MRQFDLLQAGLLLGIFVMLGGLYGAMFCASRISRRQYLMRGGVACYAAQWTVAAIIATLTPLSEFWKGFVIVSAIAYGIIPPATWKYLVHTHRTGERQ